ELGDRPAHARDRDALGAEEEALELVLVEAVQRRDLDRPLVVNQRAEELVQPDERLAHTRAQEDAVVEGAALAALVVPDVRLPDGLRPVDRIEGTSSCTSRRRPPAPGSMGITLRDRRCTGRPPCSRSPVG